MHKKDGKVFASLTEVKNKTGDIFAIVDEMGEISLTSYNKIRYKIIKVAIDDVLDLQEQKEKPAKEKKVKVQKPVKVVKEVQEKSIKALPASSHLIVNDVKEVQAVPATMIKNLISIVPWDRDNALEANFTEQSTKPLITN